MVLVLHRHRRSPLKEGDLGWILRESLSLQNGSELSGSGVEATETMWFRISPDPVVSGVFSVRTRGFRSKSICQLFF